MKKDDIQEEADKAELDQSTSWYQVLVFFVLVIIGYLWYFNKRKYKAVLQKEYGVSSHVFSKWVKLFCPAEISQKYVGQKIKTVATNDIYRYLGEPDDYPQFSRNRIIISKKDIRRAYGIGASTLTRYIKKIANPEDEIGLSIQDYKVLQSFPPSKMILICKYLEEQGHKRSI